MANRQVPFTSYPVEHELSASTQSLISSSLSLLADMPTYDENYYQKMSFFFNTNKGFANLSPPLSDLGHSLSYYMYERNGRRPYPSDRNHIEIASLKRLRSSPIADIWESMDDFFRAIEIIGLSVLNEPNPIRDSITLRTKPDAYGDYWTFAPPASVKQELARLWKFVAQSSFNPVIKASVFIVAFTSIHPLRDGNGRTSRVISNLILHENLERAISNFIPLKTMMLASQYGYDIACNQARYFGRWSIIYRWFCAVIISAHKKPLF